MLYKFMILLLYFCLFPILLHAKDIEYVDLQSRYTIFHEDYIVKNDFTVEKYIEIEIKALTENAVKELKKRRLSHSTSIEKYEILDAYTKKADGSRINVPKDNYQVTVNKGNGDNKAIFSDRTIITIIFPDLEKNDSVHMKAKIVETEPMFPNNFSTSQYFWSQNAFDDVKISFDLPEGLIFKYQVRGMTEKTKSENGRKLIELTYQSTKPVKIKRDDFSIWDEEKEAGYALSTFMDYESLAKAYGKRATPKSIPTDRVKKLAQKIIANEKNKKEQARLLYDWVVTNISYGGNCIGVGAVVPRDTDFILDNRMGDCKDHATLIEALYNSVGIESDQALVNAGSSYFLPDIPRVNAINHVINYIPVWDKFIDSTNSSLPFDQLAFSLSDKPVLLVKKFQPDKKTPATQVGDNHQEVDSNMKILPDGSVVGEIHLKAKGRAAIELRSGWRHATQEQEDQWLKDTFSSQNKIGSATMKKDDPVPLLSEFNYSITFNMPEFILPQGTGGFYVAPLSGTPMAVDSMVNYQNENISGYDVACASGYSIERLAYEFPEKMKILAKPENFEIDENYIYFKATYDLQDNKLNVVRELNDKTPGNVCSAETINNQRTTLMKIADNMKSQVIYQH